ncbi:MAG: hypothetical protein ABIA04_16255 [Pseudomonadota bacterium]
MKNIPSVDSIKKKILSKIQIDEDFLTSIIREEIALLRSQNSKP